MEVVPNKDVNSSKTLEQSLVDSSFIPEKWQKTAWIAFGFFIVIAMMVSTAVVFHLIRQQVTSVTTSFIPPSDDPDIPLPVENLTLPADAIVRAVLPETFEGSTIGQIESFPISNGNLGCIVKLIHGKLVYYNFQTKALASTPDYTILPDIDGVDKLLPYTFEKDLNVGFNVSDDKMFSAKISVSEKKVEEVREVKAISNTNNFSFTSIGEISSPLVFSIEKTDGQTVKLNVQPQNGDEKTDLTFLTADVTFPVGNITNILSSSGEKYLTFVLVYTDRLAVYHYDPDDKKKTVYVIPDPSSPVPNGNRSLVAMDGSGTLLITVYGTTLYVYTWENSIFSQTDSRNLQLNAGEVFAHNLRIDARLGGWWFAISTSQSGIVIGQVSQKDNKLAKLRKIKIPPDIISNTAGYAACVSDEENLYIHHSDTYKTFAVLKIDTTKIN